MLNGCCRVVVVAKSEFDEVYTIFVNGGVGI